MAIPQSQLETWSHQGSIQQSASTYATVKKSLEASDAGYSQKDFQVFLQGSYGNDTNIYSESDVDVVIKLDSTYFSDTSELNANQLASFNAGFAPATYLYPDYQADVVRALAKHFGNDAKPGNKAVKISASGNRRNSDVVVAAEFRKYYATNYGLDYHSGICFFDSSGNRVANYPKQHSANCTTKHQSTGNWFKPVVRILKNARNTMVDKGLIADGLAPSYFLEGLLYNVPNDQFKTSYEDCIINSINWIMKQDRSKFLCANERYYLLHDSSLVTWRASQCDEFLNGFVKLWNEW